ncbi:heparan sulfate glucosamine 3-O-sulfotransferase 6-like [Anneissia japonica]|uniref:heparan sulfate glucosamine 3-O-sulfotransferase 6-like n=1 Tax=Anneissia japonica TaxID=1529436 RepID=UPI0014256E1D|nr:heparan sulfate glucosamine 3-O-sulfotransferase 6-like [Anneissia japonica]
MEPSNKCWRFRRKCVVGQWRYVAILSSVFILVYMVYTIQPSAVVQYSPSSSVLASNQHGTVIKSVPFSYKFSPTNNLNFTPTLLERLSSGKGVQPTQGNASKSEDGADYYNDKTHQSSKTGTLNNKGTSKLPDAIIIGVKKGGTRALLEFIRLHPDVRASGPETHYFDRYYDRGEEWYRKQMPPSLEGQVTLEKTPGYFVTEKAPERIFKMSKKTKLILVVRNPVTRAISDYVQTMSKGYRNLKDFEDLLYESNGKLASEWGVIRIGMYAKHMRNWLKVFPLEQFLFVSGENLIKNPHEELGRVQTFLGLDVVIDESYFYHNQTKGFPCLKRKDGLDTSKCLGKTKGRKHPEIRPEILKQMYQFYEPWNKKFYKMIGIDFHWEDQFGTQNER